VGLSDCLACTMQFCTIVCHTAFSFILILNLYLTLYYSAFRDDCMHAVIFWHCIFLLLGR
jgi:hypothetical protein